MDDSNDQPDVKIATIYKMKQLDFVRSRYVYDQFAKKNKVLSHDSYTCGEHDGATSFPTQREDEIGNFIGSVIDLGNRIDFKRENECPSWCRRRPEWKYC